MGPMGSVGWERAMKVQEVILRAMAKRITWWQAAEIIGISERQRVWHSKPGCASLFPPQPMWPQRGRPGLTGTAPSL
jgi:hypothetical protein